MDFKTYLQTFDSILGSEHPNAPYDNPDYLNYTKLNSSRMKRWIKNGELLPSVQETLQQITEPQHWILITEPWCGDAAHSVPFIVKMAEQNPLIHLEIELRDSAPFRIEEYLTNGSKSIPVLIVRDENQNDFFHWGPRPVELQEIFSVMKSEGLSFEDTKVKLQNWYNENEGKLVQTEIQAMIQEHVFHKVLS